MRRRLARTVLPEGVRTLRVEIFDKGRLGALFATGPDNNPNLVDLYYELCARAIDVKSIAGWLKRERAAGTTSEEMLLGLGCASPTTRMPKYMVDQHASAFMPKVVSGMSGELESGVGINPLDSGNAPLGWQWFKSSEFLVIESGTVEGWQVRISPSATNRLADLREQNNSVETGGYLYGGCDYVLKQIYVVLVSDVPPGTKQSTVMIELGPAGRSSLERRIARCAGGRLQRVGTWHSHPKSGLKMSSKDRKTMEKFVAEDQENGVPTLLVITSANGIGAHLWV